MNSFHGHGAATPNIGLIKYWGKRDPDMNLPFTDSFGVVLDQAETKVNVAEWSQDEIWWQVAGKMKQVTGGLTSPYIRMMDHARAVRGQDRSLRVVVVPSLPPRVGFGSSAAAMAALAAALEDAFQLDLDLWERSILARIGSGSAARSIPDGFVQWHAGEEPLGSDSYAESVHPPEHWQELRLILVPVDPKTREVPSTRAMLRTQETSPLFEDWLDRCRVDLPLVLDAVARKDIEALGPLVEANARLMHAVALATDPPILYWNPDTIRIFEAISALRRGGVGVWATVAAGPNPVVLTLEADVEQVDKVLHDVLPGMETIVARPGLGARIGTA